MRKTVVLLALIFAGCRGTSYYQKHVTNPCSGPLPSQGFACVDPNLVPTPEPVHSPPGKWVHLFFTSGSDEMKIASEVFESTGHEGGHAWAHIKMSAIPGRRYKYTITDLTTGKSNDPDVMIDP